MPKQIQDRFKNLSGLHWLTLIALFILSVLLIILLSNPAFAKTRVSKSLELLCHPGDKVVQKSLKLDLEGDQSIFLSRYCKHNGNITLKSVAESTLEVQIGLNGVNRFNIKPREEKTWPYKNHFGGFWFTVWTVD